MTYRTVAFATMIPTIIILGLLVHAYWHEAPAPLDSKERGRHIVEESGSCRGCHQLSSSFRAPQLVSLIGKPRRLTDGNTLTIDREYLRTSLTNPGAHIAEGYSNLMPNFETIYDDETLDSIVTYLESL